MNDEQKLIKSAEEGDITSQNTLGCLYYDSNQFDKAVYWFQKSAEQGDICGQNHLGHCYEYGYGVEKNLRMALFLYQKNARQGELNLYLNTKLDRNPELFAEYILHPFYQKWDTKFETINCVSKLNLYK
jgi:TPR repeat protein